MQARVSTIPQDVVMARDIFASPASSKFSEAIGTPVGFVEQILHLAKVCTSQVYCVVGKSSLYGQYLTSDGAVIVSLRPGPPFPRNQCWNNDLDFFVFGEAPIKLSSSIGTHTAI